MGTRLEISLFGTCAVRVIGEETFEIRGGKHRALLAILATAPLGRRTRSYLQTTLWGETDYDSGNQNLRRALSDLRKLLGAGFDALFRLEAADIELDLKQVRFIGDPGSGAFLEDLNLREPGFQDWVGSVRANPDPVIALHRGAPGAQMRRRQPKVTVLPLMALGDDPKFALIGDWVAEQCCRFLSRSNLLSVISHLSSRAMAQQRVVLPEVKKTLDVDYILTGAIRDTGAKLTCDFDFIAAETGQIIWNRTVMVDSAGALDGLMGPLRDVVRAVARAIAEGAVSTTRTLALPEIEDHKLLIAGASLMHRRTIRDFIKAHEYLTEASARMPNWADPHAWLGKWYVLNVFKGFSVDRANDTQKALGCTARALDIDAESSFSLTIDGFANSNLLKNVELAGQRYDAAIDLNPNASLAWLLSGAGKAFSDDGAAAIDATRMARELSPIDPFGYYFDSLTSSAYLAAERYDKALEFADKSLAVNDRHLSTLRAKITALYFLGRVQDARDVAQVLCRRYPDFRLDDYKREHPGAKNLIGQRVIEALAGAGIH
ncbi:hypothetical protein [Aliiroseovarius crassostreae]|uniref:hypothetical protein n=1 Tax=Aliiroseovarius crassostreae TaxID=154981 RepID=UPI003C7B938E